MKNLLFSIAMIGLLSAVGQAQPSVAVSIGGPNLSVDQEVFDYGTIIQGSNGSRIFTVTNTGDQPLIISKCDKTCGCTIPKCDPKPMLTGETSEIVVTYDTKRLGPFTKSVKVHSNDPEEPLKILRIHGTVVAE